MIDRLQKGLPKTSVAMGESLNLEQMCPAEDSARAANSGGVLHPESCLDNLHSLRQELLDLFCKVAYRTGSFVLSSGARSSYYINGKQVTLHPQGAGAIAQLLISRLPPTTQAVAGLTLGADPIVTAVSVISGYENRPAIGGIPALIVRKEPKGHGTQAYIEGPTLAAGSLVIVLEDVVTTGQSALLAVERLRQAGYAVNQIIALVDRQQGGAALYQSSGLEFEAIFSIQDIQERWQQLQP